MKSHRKSHSRKKGCQNGGRSQVRLAAGDNDSNHFMNCTQKQSKETNPSESDLDLRGQRQHDETVKGSRKSDNLSSSVSHSSYSGGLGKRIQKQQEITSVACPVCGRDLKNKMKLKTHLKSCMHTNYSHLNIELNHRDTTKKMLKISKQSKLKISSGFKEKPKGLVKSGTSAGGGNQGQEKTKPPTCEVCGKVFARLANVILHMRLHRGERPFPCAACGKRFRRSDHLKNHGLVHIKKRPHQCSLCSETFKRRDHLKYHEINNHGAKIYLNELKCYTRTAKCESENKVILCDVCGVAFASERNLKNHLRLHVNQGKFSCPHCQKVFNQSSNLNIHLRKHTGETPYKCFSCDESFATSSKLKTHARKHTGDLPFTCEICGRLFGESHLLKMHMRIHGNQKLYKCSHCSKTFTHSSTLRAHIRTHTGARPYKCDQCGHAFAQISSLTYHKRTHTGEKPYSCHICGNSYTRMATLNVHLTKHTGQKHASCPSCNFKCDTLKHLRKHMAKFHGDLSDNVDLLFKQKHSRATNALYAEGFIASSADSEHLSSVGAESCVNESHEEMHRNSTEWNNDQSASRHEDMSSLTTCTDKSDTPGIVKSGLVINSDRSYVCHDKLSVAGTMNIHNPPSMPCVYGLIGFPDIPKYTGSSMVASSLLDAVHQQSTQPAVPGSYLALLNSSTPSLESADDTMHSFKTRCLPEELSSPLAMVQSHLHNIASIREEPDRTQNPSCHQDVHYSFSSPNQAPGYSMPSLDVGRHNTNISQNSQENLLTSMTSMTESFTSADSQSHSNEICHAQNSQDIQGGEVNCEESTTMKEPGFKKAKSDDSDKDEKQADRSEISSQQGNDFGKLRKSHSIQVLPIRSTEVIQAKREVLESEQVSYKKTLKSPERGKGVKLRIRKVRQNSSSDSKSSSELRDVARLAKTARAKSCKGSIECSFCGQTFSRTGNLKTHMRLHSGERPYSCRICDKRYTRSDHLKTHMLLHKGDNSMICNHCGDSFSNLDQLSKHTEDKHGGINPFACGLCNFSSIHLRELKDHIKDHHEEKRTFDCDICHIPFIKVKDLKKHMKSHDGQSAFVCHSCKKSFKESSCLKLHIMTKHTGEKRFKCGVCDEKYVTAAKLQRHMRNHNGARPFACEFCGKMFIDTCLLKMHARIHTKEKPFKCNHCEQSFTHKSTLRAHVRIHTGNKPYRCETCGASFAQVSSLTYHRRRHDGLKPYTCHICGNSYTRSTTLSIHMTRHTGQKRVPCPHCVFKFDTPKHLRKHLAKAHNSAEPVGEQAEDSNQQREVNEEQPQEVSCDKPQNGEHPSEKLYQDQHRQFQMQQPLHTQQQNLQPQHQQLPAPQILFLPQPQQHFQQQSFKMVEPPQQHHFLIHQHQSRAQVALHQIQPSSFLTQHQQHHHQQTMETSSDAFQSMMCVNSAEFVQRCVIFPASGSVSHTY